MGTQHNIKLIYYTFKTYTFVMTVGHKFQKVTMNVFIFVGIVGAKYLSYTIFVKHYLMCECVCGCVRERERE